MIFNGEFLTRNFERFNREIFRNELPKVRFECTRARTYAAQYCYRKSPFLRKTIPESRCIRYSIFHGFSEKVLEEILIHEMLHLYIEVKKLKDTSPHGHIFKALSAQINESYGYNVNVSLKAETATNSGDAGNNTESGINAQCCKRQFFCLLELDDGNYGVCTVTQSALFKLWDKLGPAFNCRHWKWYVSRHAFFQKFPKTREKMRYYKVAESDITPLMGEMHELIHQGDHITWK